MESFPLPALPADPVPPPPASRQASEDRGFADALRAAHGDDAEPDRKPASERREAGRPHRNDHPARRHATHHHDDARQDTAAAAAAPIAPVAVAATDSGAGTKSTAETTAGDTPVVPQPADAAATPADMSVASDAIAAAAPDQPTDKTAVPPSGAAADFAAAVRDGDHVAAATTDAASKSDGDAKKTDGASRADEPAPESARTQDKAPGETTAIPAMPAVAAQPTAGQPTAVQPAAPVDGNVATATAEIAAGDVQAAAGSARPAAAGAPAPVKAKTDGKPDKTAATNDAADSSHDGKADAGRSIKAGREDDAADGKTSDRGAKKDDAAKDKSASPTDVGGLSKPDGGTTTASGRPADAAPAPQPVDGASTQSTAPAHQAAPAPGAMTAPASTFMHDLRAQAQLQTQQTQQTQPSAADAAPRLPAPPADQVAVEIGRAVQQGHDRFSLELRPGDLGRISVDLQLGSDQRVVAVIHADRHDTLQLLQKDSHTLQRALQDAGLQTDSGSLSFNLRGEGGGSQRSFADLAGDARPIALRVPVAAAEAAAQLVRPWRIGDTGIDIRV